MTGSEARRTAESIKQSGLLIQFFSRRNIDLAPRKNAEENSGRILEGIWGINNSLSSEWMGVVEPQQRVPHAINGGGVPRGGDGLWVGGWCKQLQAAASLEGSLSAAQKQRQRNIAGPEKQADCSPCDYCNWREIPALSESLGLVRVVVSGREGLFRQCRENGSVRLFSEGRMYPAVPVERGRGCDWVSGLIGRR